ncbi:alpha-amylase [Candidatus Uabimicrobium amorphum]|uniref:Alpha-amylase n=2 Tax=Uabimicrobium amorphum TaxID=2596890 RepID=A0A5S9F6A4_UABAM|nr:alpha-amylase [Candidatus Uabimicrobium amorphum]
MVSVYADTLTVHYRNSNKWQNCQMHWGFNDYQKASDLKPSGKDAYGVFFHIKWSAKAPYLKACFNGDGNAWDGVDRRITKPQSLPTEVWIKNNDSTVYFTNPVDLIPPQVQITSLNGGEKLTGKVNLTAKASDNKGIARVDFYCDKVKLGTATASPYNCTWNSGYSKNGKHSITAKAIDLTGNVAVSTAKQVTTDNPNMSPIAKIGKGIYGIVGFATHFDGSKSIDPNGSIESYTWTTGEGGNMSGATPKHVYNKAGKYEVTLTVTDNEGATAQTSTTVHIAGAPNRGDFREETIYFLMTTRFFDGDADNNYRSDDPQNKNPQSDPEWRGDFKGLVEKLDYIKALGFSAIWITPVVENKSGYDYHGYHASDFTKVDPRLESVGYNFQRLIYEVHKRDMKLVLDVVFNHSGNWGARPLFAPKNNPDLDPQKQFLDRIQQMFKSPFYHEGWLSSWESYDEQNKSIAGDCVDLNTENAKVRQHLIDSYKKYIDMGVDGFRVDTVKHISRYVFNRYFNQAFQQHGGEHFFMFGEVCTRVRGVWNRDIPSLSSPFYTWKENKDYSHMSDKEAVYQHWLDNRSNPGAQPRSNNHYLDGNNYRKLDYSAKSNMNVIDFPMHWNFENAHTAFSLRFSDDCYNDATWNVVYVDSHDYGPDNGGHRYNGGAHAWAENMSLMFTFRGIPCLYYGSEIEFQAGAKIDEGMNAPLSATGRAYFGEHIKGSVQVQDFGVFSGTTGEMATTLDHPLAQHLARLNRIRRQVPALQKGQYSTSDVSGSLAFKRRFTDEKTDSFALVTISSGATFNNIPNGRYVDAVTGNVQQVTNNTLQANCSGQGNMRVYVLDNAKTPAPGKIGDAQQFLR